MPRPEHRQGVSRRVNSLELRRKLYDAQSDKGNEKGRAIKRPGSQKK